MVKEAVYGEGGYHHTLLTILKASRGHQDMENPGNGYLVVMFPETIYTTLEHMKGLGSDLLVLKSS